MWSKKDKQYFVFAGVGAAACLCLGIITWKLDATTTNGKVAMESVEQSASIPMVESSVREETEEPEESGTEESPEVEKELTGAQELDEGMIVEAPRFLEVDELKPLFQEREKEDARYSTVIEKMDSMPKALLMDLAVNPEMISFVVNFPDGYSENREIRDVEMQLKCPLFLQWDPRWGYDPYGDGSTIAVSGCGPTALAMVATALTQEKISPAEIAAYAMDNQYYLSGVGTMWSLMTKGAKQFGLSSEHIYWGESLMREKLRAGEFLILSMKAGDFTLNGHFIVIYDCDEEGFYVNDPMCIYRSKQVWTYERLKDQIKGVWALRLWTEEDDIRESEEVRANAMIARGISELQYPPAYMNLFYMITVCSNGDIKYRSGEEQKILGRIIQIFHDYSC